jgi:hypothetical protein
MAEESDELFGKYSAIFEPVSENLLALIQWDLDGDTVYRYNNKWNPILDAMMDEIDSKVISTVSEDFIAVVDKAVEDNTNITRSESEKYFIESGE